MTKEQATIARDHILQLIEDGAPYLCNAWLTNLQGTDIWFVDYETYNPHDNGGTQDFLKEGFDENFR